MKTQIRKGNRVTIEIDRSTLGWIVVEYFRHGWSVLHRTNNQHDAHVWRLNYLKGEATTAARKGKKKMKTQILTPTERRFLEECREDAAPTGEEDPRTKADLRRQQRRLIKIIDRLLQQEEGL